MTEQTAEKVVFYPRFLYFTVTIDGYWRVIMVSSDDLMAHSVIMDNEVALKVQEWLASGQLGTFKLEDEFIDVVLAPTNQAPVYWQVITEPMKHWKRRIARASSALSPKADHVPFEGII